MGAQKWWSDNYDKILELYSVHLPELPYETNEDDVIHDTEDNEVIHDTDDNEVIHNLIVVVYI
ncbi:hypothetical protein AXF42_Ash018696 [Apostasia shenzhenica]|uniref:BRX domain-containing protein n=1 Tax=Apostasia shenzhenica TaxID=1088818 RepID=A0A2H9ZZN7_9ASPA|nr:hypothetical protein AXF42_Ash018696 [Apostasia shenzhenica]